MQHSQPRTRLLCLLFAAPDKVRQQNRTGWNCGKNISRQLRLRQREKCYRQQEPHRKIRTQIFRSGWLLYRETPVANGIYERDDDKDSPRHQREQRHRHVKPEGLSMVIEVGAKTSHVVLQKEGAEELGIGTLHCYKPG